MHNPSSDSDSSYWNMLFYCYHSEAHKRHINSICRPSKRSQPRAAAETDERCTTGENEIGACCRALGRNDDRCSTVLFHMARLQRGVRTNTGTLWLTSPNTVGGDWSETMIVVFFCLFVWQCSHQCPILNTALTVSWRSHMGVYIVYTLSKGFAFGLIIWFIQWLLEENDSAKTYSIKTMCYLHPGSNAFHIEDYCVPTIRRKEHQAHKVYSVFVFTSSIDENKENVLQDLHDCTSFSRF